MENQPGAKSLKLKIRRKGLFVLEQNATGVMELLIILQKYFLLELKKYTLRDI